MILLVRKSNSRLENESSCECFGLELAVSAAFTHVSNLSEPNQKHRRQVAISVCLSVWFVCQNCLIEFQENYSTVSALTWLVCSNQIISGNNNISEWLLVCVTVRLRRNNPRLPRAPAFWLLIRCWLCD